MVRRSSKLHAYCGKAIALAEADTRLPGMPARQGTAFHAGVAWARGGESHRPAWDAAKKDLNKAPKAMAEVMSWLEACSIWEIPENATYEAAVGLDSFGGYVDHNDARAVVTGHIDAHWMDEAEDAVRVVDWKSSQYDQGDPDRLIQLVAYGAAISDLHGKPVILGIGYARTAALVWGKKQWPDWRAVLDSAALPNVAVLGEHCRSCWESRNCAEFLANSIPTWAPAEVTP